MNREQRTKFNRYMAGRRRQQRHLKLKRVKLTGGPFDGETLMMNDPEAGTLTFRVRDWKGSYVHRAGSLMVWRNA